jgi:hypothetical protein
MPDVLARSPQNTAVEVNPEAPAASPVVSSAPPVVRRRTVVVGALITIVVAALAGGGVGWNRAVTADPGLEFYGGPNVFRDAAGTDLAGIVHKDNKVGSEGDVAFVAGGRLYASYGLYNGGPRDVRIEGLPPARFYYWALDRRGHAGGDRRAQLRPGGASHRLGTAPRRHRSRRRPVHPRPDRRRLDPGQARELRAHAGHPAELSAAGPDRSR